MFLILVKVRGKSQQKQDNVINVHYFYNYEILSIFVRFSVVQLFDGANHIQSFPELVEVT